MKTLNVEQAAEMIHSAKFTGKFISVKFTKEDGAFRSMMVKFKLDNDKLSPEPSLFRYNPADYGNIVCNDVNIFNAEKKRSEEDPTYKPRSSFRTIKLSRLIGISADGENYLIRHEEEE